MFIGIDLGGTKIEAVLLDRNGEVQYRRRVPTPKGNYSATLKAIYDLVIGAESHAGENCSVGIGTPGSISITSGLLKNSNSICLNHQPLLSDLEQRLNRSVRLSNDANCFCVSEAIDGAGRGYTVVFGVIIGTGTGAGICINGQALAGPNGIAGEWGHNSLPWADENERPGPDCYCGKSGCIETFLSGPAMAADHLHTSGQALETMEIVANAEQGNKHCEQTLARYERRLAKALAHVINILDPDIIVLGGGMSNIDRLYENIPRLWGEYVFSDSVETKLAKAMHGDSSGVRGAAWLWAEKE